jgi:hypothetical protein
MDGRLKERRKEEPGGFEGGERNAAVRRFFRSRGVHAGWEWQNIDCIELLQVINRQCGGKPSMDTVY